VADKKKIRFSSASYRVHPRAIKNLEIKIKPHKPDRHFYGLRRLLEDGTLI
jgi:hypothetical protein